MQRRDFDKYVNDKELVTRVDEAGNVEVLEIIGQIRAQWVKIGEMDRAEGAPRTYRWTQAKGPQGNVVDGTEVRQRDDGSLEVLVVIDDLYVAYRTTDREVEWVFITVIIGERNFAAVIPDRRGIQLHLERR